MKLRARDLEQGSLLSKTAVENCAVRLTLASRGELVLFSRILHLNRPPYGVVDLHHSKALSKQGFDFNSSICLPMLLFDTPLSGLRSCQLLANQQERSGFLTLAWLHAVQKVTLNLLQKRYAPSQCCASNYFVKEYVSTKERCAKRDKTRREKILLTCRTTKRGHSKASWFIGDVSSLLHR